ncbi:hypothetical protein [Singulisphaera sp. PoT]|uniref:hypothetical protein n=1 Tax=Singulisphaera sp. PoT TaxID=3411797 RepID=UPI003BF58A12
MLLGLSGIASASRRRGAVGCEALLALVAAFILVSATADDKAVVRPAAEAKDHLDEEGTYELVVRTTKNAEPRKVYYLDSEEDFHDEKNLAIVITYADAEKFEKLGIKDPSTHYKGKTIRVKGKVINESSQTRIHVTEPSQIEVVEAAKPAKTP